MFMIVASSLCALIIFYMMFKYGQYKQSNDKRHAQISELRSLVEHLEEHRKVTHTHLCFEAVPSAHTQALEQNIIKSIDILLDKSPVGQRPMFRLLKKQVDELLSSWQEISPERSQMKHGKAIRVTLYLIDDIVFNWLIEHNHLESSARYSTQWHNILDTLEALTQFRMVASNWTADNSHDLLLTKAQVLHRRINRLSLISPLGVAAPSTQQATQLLTELIATGGAIESLDQQEIYNMTTDLSFSIFRVYDQMLIDILARFDQPAPKISTNV